LFNGPVCRFAGWTIGRTDIRGTDSKFEVRDRTGPWSLSYSVAREIGLQGLASDRILTRLKGTVYEQIDRGQDEQYENRRRHHSSNDHTCETFLGRGADAGCDRGRQQPDGGGQGGH